jgi:hypothetical protein
MLKIRRREAKDYNNVESFQALFLLAHYTNDMEISDLNIHFLIIIGKY